MSTHKEGEKTEPELPITKDQQPLLYYKKPATDRQRAAASKARATQLANRRKLQEWREAVATRLQTLEERIRIVELEQQAQEDVSVIPVPMDDTQQISTPIEKEHPQYTRQSLPPLRSQMTIAKSTQTQTQTHHPPPAHVEKPIHRRRQRAHQLW